MKNSYRKDIRNLSCYETEIKRQEMFKKKRSSLVELKYVIKELFFLEKRTNRHLTSGEKAYLECKYLASIDEDDLKKKKKKGHHEEVSESFQIKLRHGFINGKEVAILIFNETT